MAYLSRALSRLRKERTQTATEPWVRDQIDGIAPGGGGGATDLSYDPGSRLLSSSTGLDATLPLVDGTNAGLMASADKTKLDGVAAGATVNATDASLRDRATHTGTQLAATISDFASAVAALITGKANTVHSHTSADVTDFSEAVDDRVAALLVAGANTTLTYNDATNTLTIASAGGGGSGPSPAISWVI